LLSQDGVLEIEKDRDAGRYREPVLAALDAALAQAEDARKREGERCGEHISRELAALEDAAGRVAAHVRECDAALAEDLRRRMQEFFDGAIDENRILQEAALTLMKLTIAEELERLGAHIAAFREETANNPRPGKKLDFLCQEMNREINTIGSKRSAVEVSRAVVAMKECLENIREQLRNVE
jgi:uncharacterized protein (TIGR00255 family)